MNTKSNKKILLILIILSVLLIIVFIVDLFLGSVTIPFKEVLKILISGKSENQIWSAIIYDFRLPKAITAVLAGAALSVSGLQMQTIFRNPLAGPYVLGISSGASLGVAILVLGFSSYLTNQSVHYFGNWAQVIAAWIGAGLVLFLILAVSMRVQDIMTILILGILFGSATSAIVSIFQYFSHQSMLKAFVIWSMGSLGNLSKSQLNILMPCIIAGLCLSLLFSRILNVLLLGETYARSLGVNIKFSRVMLFISTSILAGSITAFCGPIGFIGIAVPHIVKIITKSADHYYLIPGSILAGAIILLLSDIISLLPGSDSILPVNSVTALLGIPVVIWIIIKNKKIASLS
ncbi:MAG: iron ABC transporter permease [Bacteroidales bacterium]|nr:MAG: iron ABC transporter permease [Bacteroidales bacterium]